MIYVMSDLHGMYSSYLKILRKIHFCDADTLYILGDVIDRGPQPIQILQDMMLRPNVYPLFGNHEWMAMQCLDWITEEITDTFLASLDTERLIHLADWMGNGASTTLAGYAALTKDAKADLLDYLCEFQAYEELYLNGQTFLLVHAGLGNFNPDKALTEYTIDELVWERPNLEKPYFDDPTCHVVVGHTPTLMLTGKPEVFTSNGCSFIDCGACFDVGRLACLCLDTMQAYYV